MLTGRGGVHKNLTFADGGEGGVQNGQKNADVINERPLSIPYGAIVTSGNAKVVIKVAISHLEIYSPTIVLLPMSTPFSGKAKRLPDMEKGADTRTLSAEILEDCGNLLIVEDYAPLFSEENLFLVEMFDETFNIWHIYSL